MSSIPAEKCLAIIHQALVDLTRHDHAAAEAKVAAAVVVARTLPQDEARSCLPLATAAFALVRFKEGSKEGSAKLRPIALRLFDEIDTPIDNILFPQLAANIFNDLQEFQRAIPFY